MVVSVTVGVVIDAVTSDSQSLAAVAGLGSGIFMGTVTYVLLTESCE